jgi:hypothetical protein
LYSEGRAKRFALELTAPGFQILNCKASASKISRAVVGEAVIKGIPDIGGLLFGNADKLLKILAVNDNFASENAGAELVVRSGTIAEDNGF